MGPMSALRAVRVAGVVAALLLAGCSTAVPITPGATGPGAATASNGIPAMSSATAGTTPTMSVTASTAASTPTPTSSSTTSTAPSTTRPPSTSTTTTAPPTSTSLAVGRNADGSCRMPSALAGRDLTTLGTGATRKVIALTFDGGASSAGAQKILATLQQTGSAATFFFTGQFANGNPSLVRSIAATYPIGNHSFSHPDMTTLSSAAAAKQIADGEAAIVRASGGVSPVPFFRFPLGARNATTIGLVNHACYIPFRWTVDSLGWVGTTGTATLPGQTVQRVTDRVLAGATPGGIILMHLGDNPDDGSTLDADALPGIIAGLRAKGYTLVTLREALRA